MIVEKDHVLYDQKLAEFVVGCLGENMHKVPSKGAAEEIAATHVKLLNQLKEQ